MQPPSAVIRQAVQRPGPPAAPSLTYQGPVRSLCAPSPHPWAARPACRCWASWAAAGRPSEAPRRLKTLPGALGRLQRRKRPSLGLATRCSPVLGLSAAYRLADVCWADWPRGRPHSPKRRVLKPLLPRPPQAKSCWCCSLAGSMSTADRGAERCEVRYFGGRERPRGGCDAVPSAGSPGSQAGQRPLLPVGAKAHCADPRSLGPARSLPSI